MVKIKNVISRTCYDKVLDAIKNPIEMWTTTFQDGRPAKVVTEKKPLRLDENGLTIYPFSHRYISEILTDKRISEIPPDAAIFIDAQTGLGKTQWIFKKLYPWLHRKGMRLLYFASRSALKDKAKYDAIDAAKTDHRERFTEYGLQREHCFGDIDIFSYQDLFNDEAAIKKNWTIIEEHLPSYGAVVFDEAHFFVADAEFNPYTQKALNSLTATFHEAKIPRFYLTGTPDDVLGEIYQREKDFCDNRRDDTIMSDGAINIFDAKHGFKSRCYQPLCSPLYFYHFGRDYRYLNLIMAKEDDLIDKINKLSNVKWIIFIDDKTKGAVLRARLESNHNVWTLDSKSLHDKDDQTTQNYLKRLTDDEELVPDVLITTKCLDVGVTIKTRNVHLVCYLTNRIDFVQAIGRKRVKDTEKVNLFIPEYTKKNVRNWLFSTNQEIVKYNNIRKYWQEGAVAYCSSIPQGVYIENGKYRLNHLIATKLYHQKRDLECLLEIINSTSAPETMVIANFFASWLGKANPLAELEAASAAGYTEMDKKLMNIVSCYRVAPMNDVKFKKLCMDLKPFDPRKDNRAAREALTTQTVNRILKPLGLKIDRCKVQHNVTYQIVEGGGGNNNVLCSHN